MSKSNAGPRQGGLRFASNSPLYEANLSSNARAMPWAKEGSGWGGGGCTWILLIH